MHVKWIIKYNVTFDYNNMYQRIYAIDTFVTLWINMADNSGCETKLDILMQIYSLCTVTWSQIREIDIISRDPRITCSRCLLLRLMHLLKNDLSDFRTLG